MTKEKLTLYVDASSLAYTGCWKLFHYINPCGYKPKLEQGEVKTGSIGMHYGTACHLFTQILRNTGDFGKAVGEGTKKYMELVPEVPESDFRTVAHLQKSFYQYYKEMWLGDNLKTLDAPMVEGGFEVPYYEDDDFIIMLSGTIDQIGMIEDQLIIVDRKCTALWDANKNPEMWLSSYNMSLQMKFYSMVVEQLLGKPLPVMIEGWFLSKQTNTKFKRSEWFYWNKAQREEFRDYIKDKIERIVYNLHHDEWPRDFTQCTSHKFSSSRIGTCPFFYPCEQPNKVEEAEALSAMFRVKKYNPKTFGEKD